MKTICYPEPEEWGRLIQRNTLDTEALRETVRTVLEQVRKEGDKAVLELEEKFDKVRLLSLIHI